MKEQQTNFEETFFEETTDEFQRNVIQRILLTPEISHSILSLKKL